MHCFGFNRSSRGRSDTELEYALSALQASADRASELEKQRVELTDRLTDGIKREEQLRMDILAFQEREQQTMQRINEQSAQLTSALELNVEYERRLHACEIQRSGMVSEIQLLREQVDLKHRQAKLSNKQVLELKTEIGRKVKQQELLKSKYLKMQEAMKMLEEVVVCVVGGQPDVPITAPGSRNRPSQPPKPDRSAAMPAPEVVAKRFIQLRQSANELRQSFAALSIPSQPEADTVDPLNSETPEPDTSSRDSDTAADVAFAADAVKEPVPRKQMGLTTVLDSGHRVELTL